MSTDKAPLPEAVRELLTEWDLEVQQHGIWTNGHAIGARLADALRRWRAAAKQEREGGTRAD